MRTLMLLACSWWVCSFSPLPGSASPVGFGVSGASGVTRRAANVSAVTVRDVLSAAREAGIPPTALLAEWMQESSARAFAPAGDGGRSFGPFQIQAVAAARHACTGAWRRGPANARCAARILADYRAATGRWTGAFTAYQWPEHRRDKPSAYGVEVYHRMLRLQLQAQRMKPMLTRIP